MKPFNLLGWFGGVWMGSSESAKLMFIMVLSSLLFFGTFWHLEHKPQVPEWYRQEAAMPCPMCSRPMQWVAIQKAPGSKEMDTKKEGSIMIIGVCPEGHVHTFINKAVK